MRHNWLIKGMTLLILLGMVASSSISLPAVASGNISDTIDATRTGAWVDSVTFTNVDQADVAISQLQADELDIYAYGLRDTGIYQTVQADPNLAYSESTQNYTELTFNPYGPEFIDGRLNPFSNRKIREAMNKLIDREAMLQQIYGGMGLPKYTTLQVIGADTTRYLNTVNNLKYLYGYNPSQAQLTINAEMLGMGATLGGDNKWQYDGAPVVIIFIIRVEDERTPIGDYVADQLESIGFTVDRQYKNRTEASPIWMNSDPAEGLWHIYTGLWVDSAISRDEASNFGFFYTNLAMSSPLWQAYTPTADFYEVAEKLWNNDFASMAERDTLFISALQLSMQDSVRVWLLEGGAFWPRQADTVITSDLVSGLRSKNWPYTARFSGLEGGNMRIAQPGLLVEPWNPIAGSNWIYDQVPIYATQEADLMPDPTTGLAWPQRIERAEVVARDGIVMQATHDWVTLTYTPTITVPADAWVDWDATNQVFITSAEQYPEGLTANIKSTVYYPADLFDTVKWHDGSPLDLGDFVMKMILTFDRAKVDSAIYDDSTTWEFESFLSYFRGVRIISETPLVIETYLDSSYLDAETNLMSWWPNMNYGPGAWHNLAMGVRAEAAEELAFSSAKATLLGIEWMNYIAEPSLSILENQLIAAAGENYIPYAPTMSSYVTEGEATTRWTNLSAWYTAKGHFWLGTGPFYLENADPAVPTLTLNRFADYPDPADKWDFFVQPPTLAINYPSGAPGSYLNLTGDNYPPNQTATIYLNDVTLGTAPISASGTFTFTLTTEEATEGTYLITASVNPTATVKFVLDSDSEVRPLEGSYLTFEVPAEAAYTFEAYLTLILNRP